MCTVTLVPNEGGVRLMCNRDERRSRPAALPPRVHDLDGCRAIFPLDPTGGGSWIGVNEAGLAVALLNAQRTPHAAKGRYRRRSRGLIVTDLLRCASLRAAMATVETLDSSAFEPFTLVMVHAGMVGVATSDAFQGTRCASQWLDRPFLFTSSSLGDALVSQPRQSLFARMVLESRAGWRDGQARFHRHQWSRRPEISVRMERADALTVSRTRVDSAGATRRVIYEAPVDAVPSQRVRQCCSLH